MSNTNEKNKKENMDMDMDLDLDLDLSNTIYVSLNGQPVEVDAICAYESDYLRFLYQSGYNGMLPLNIKRSSILEKALDFCKKRAQLWALYSRDEGLLHHAFKCFDKEFFKHIQGDDAIDLLEAADSLLINSLVDPVFEYIKKTRKTPEDIEKIFPIRYNGDDTQFLCPTDRPTMSNTNEKNKEEKKAGGMAKSKIYVNLYGKPVEVDLICAHESDYLRFLYKTGYNGMLLFNIKRSSILEKALDFCKKRAGIRAICFNDEGLLHHALKHFDSHFLKHIQGDDAIDLLDAAGSLQINRLVDLLFDDVVHMIAQKTPEDIEKIFHIRFNGDDTRLNWMNYIMDNALWHLK